MLPQLLNPIFTYIKISILVEERSKNQILSKIL